MHRFLVERHAFQGGRAVLTGAAFHHAARVVRLRPGDLIALFDGSGSEWIARVTSIARDRLEAEILREAGGVEPPVSVTLLQAVLKGERMDWLVQKCGELGAARLAPMLTERTVARVPAERAAARRKRWQRIADSAAEQCGRRRPMTVEEIAPLTEAAREFAGADLALVPHEAERTRSLRGALRSSAATPCHSERSEESRHLFVAIAIGPEGGFTEGEIEVLVGAGGVTVSLGPRILRAETAALFAVSAVLYALGDLPD